MFNVFLNFRIVAGGQNSSNSDHEDCIPGIGTTRVAKLKLYRVRVRFLRAKKRRNEESPESF